MSAGSSSGANDETEESRDVAGLSVEYSRSAHSFVIFQPVDWGAEVDAVSP